MVFVLTDVGLEDDPPATVEAIAEYARLKLHAEVLVDSSGVTVLEWHPPRGTMQVGIPNPFGLSATTP